MFNYVVASFPDTSTPPAHVYSLDFYQTRYEHEIAVLQFRDWGIEYDVVQNGSPVTFTLNDSGKARTFYGYVHHVNVNREPGSFLTEVVVLSSSMLLKNQSQKVWTNLSADGIIQNIANAHGFAAYTVPHPRIYDQVSQAGHTDWELMVRLAKQSGYSLRTENTEIYFQPLLHEYENKKSEAPLFVMRDANDPSGSTIYSFSPTISESLEYDGDSKAAIAISGFDSATNSNISSTSQKPNKNTKLKYSREFFDKYDTSVVATNAAIAQYESEAAENRSQFPYRAVAEVAGDPFLRPDLPVYLEGVGSLYSGYWTVLGTQHIVVEEKRNSHKYTTVLYLGSDSLGPSTKWNNGNVVQKTNSRASRTIIPGVRQTNVVPKTRIVKVAPNLGPQNKGSFGNVKNRAKSNLSSPVWKTATANLNPVQQSNKSTSAQPKRLLNRTPGIL